MVRVAHNQMSTTAAAGWLRAPFPLDEPRDDSSSRLKSRRSSRHRADRLLAIGEEPPLGAHLVTPRFAYAHHGVYVGGGAVVHYAAFAKCWRRGPVEQISLSRFAHRNPVWVRPGRRDTLPCAEIVRRARSRVGENRYRFFRNNCEHFSEWCVNGEPRSLQVERLLAHLQPLTRALHELWRHLQLLPPRPGTAPRPIH
jgi:Lecithin retinol acyltransferase